MYTMSNMALNAKRWAIDCDRFSSSLSGYWCIFFFNVAKANLALMVLRRPFTNIVQIVLVHWKNWLPILLAIFSPLSAKDWLLDYRLTQVQLSVCAISHKKIDQIHFNLTWLFPKAWWYGVQHTLPPTLKVKVTTNVFQEFKWPPLFFF